MNLLSQIEVGCLGDNFQFCEWLFFPVNSLDAAHALAITFLQSRFSSLPRAKKCWVCHRRRGSHCRTPRKMHKIIFIPQAEWITSNGTENFDIKAVMCSQSHRHCVPGGEEIYELFEAAMPSQIYFHQHSRSTRRWNMISEWHRTQNRWQQVMTLTLLFASREAFVVCFSLFCDPLYQFRAAEMREWNKKTKVFLLFALRYCLEAADAAVSMWVWKSLNSTRSDHQR